MKRTFIQAKVTDTTVQLTPLKVPNKLSFRRYKHIEKALSNAKPNISTATLLTPFEYNEPLTLSMEGLLYVHREYKE